MTPAAINVVAKNGFDPEYGARPIRRALQRDVEDRLSELVLTGDAQPGDTVTIGAKQGKLTFTTHHPQVQQEPVHA